MDALIATLERLGGYYECPKDGNTRLGPLVGYAGRYDDNGTKKQWIGDIYANFAVLEASPRELGFFTNQLAAQINDKWGALPENFTVCGMPMGGIATGALLEHNLHMKFVYPEKKVLEAATPTNREKSKLIWARHSISTGEQVFLVEDVLNNFSTTEEAVNLVKEAGGNVRAIIGLLNRSLTHHGTFRCVVQKNTFACPIVCITQMPINEYKQDDPAVADDIKRGNIVWKPKDEWPRLQQATKMARK